MPEQTETTDTTETTEITGTLLSTGLGRPELMGFESASVVDLAAKIDSFITDNPKINVTDIHYRVAQAGPYSVWHSALVLYESEPAESGAA